MQDLIGIGLAWQGSECKRLGITIKEHNQLIEATVRVSTAKDISVIDAYRDVVDIIEDKISAKDAADFLETLEGNDG